MPLAERASQLATRLKDTACGWCIYATCQTNLLAAELTAILTRARTMFINDEVDAVDVIYTEFINSMHQEVTVKRVLPAGFNETEVSR